MAITKQFKDGAPADDAEITSAPTNLGKLDDNTAAAICLGHRMEVVGEDSKYYDAKQAFSYASGTWDVIIDNDRDDGFCFLRIVVTDAAGAQLRIIHDFGRVTIGTAGDDTSTATGVAQQDLLATERLAVFVIHDDGGEPRVEIGVDNFDTTCDSRLVTPDEAAAAVPGDDDPFIPNAEPEDSGVVVVYS